MTCCMASEKLGCSAQVWTTLERFKGEWKMTIFIRVNYPFKWTLGQFLSIRQTCLSHCALTQHDKRFCWQDTMNRCTLNFCADCIEIVSSFVHCFYVFFLNVLMFKLKCSGYVLFTQVLKSQYLFFFVFPSNCILADQHSCSAAFLWHQPKEQKNSINLRNGCTTMNLRRSENLNVFLFFFYIGRSEWCYRFLFLTLLLDLHLIPSSLEKSKCN